MTRKKIQPEYLKPGDEAAIISSSFFIEKQANIEVKDERATLPFG